jgi:hypothetical protein
MKAGRVETVQLGEGQLRWPQLGAGDWVEGGKMALRMGEEEALWYSSQFLCKKMSSQSQTN